MLENAGFEDYEYWLEVKENLIKNNIIHE